MNSPTHTGCLVPGCQQPHRARGLCRTHYARWHRTGTPLIDGRRDRAARAADEPTAPTRPPSAIRAKVPDGGTITRETFTRIRAAVRDVHFPTRGDAA